MYVLIIAFKLQHLKVDIRNKEPINQTKSLFLTSLVQSELNYLVMLKQN